MTVVPQQVIHEARKYLGWPYGFRDRCHGSYHETDCSGLICIVMNALGLYVGCLSSFQFANLAWDHNLVIPLAMAHQYECLLIAGPNGGRGPSQAVNGSDGHIGFGNKTTSIEERGHAYGCVEIPLDTTRFDIACWIPGADYSPQTFTEPNMIIQEYHYGADGRKIRIPDRHNDHSWILPTVAVTPDGKAVHLKDGASFTGAGKPNFGEDIFAPPEVAAHGRIVGLAKFVPQDGSAHIIVIRFGDGFQKPYRFT